MTLLNALTVDVEDYYQVSAFEDEIDRSRWESFESRVVANTQRLLDVFSAAGVRGTFFILGWTAERFPELVKQIVGAGHELGSHGYWHRLVYRQQPSEFRQDLARSRDVLEQIGQVAVRCYRAPSFSITKQSTWALEILADEGFQVDSSIFPIHHDRYGIPGAKAEIHRIETPAGPLTEFPPAVVKLGRWNLPVSGGGYFRLYPLAWSKLCIRRINRAGRSFMFYIHPWELDPEQPRLSVGTRARRFRHYVNLRHTQHKLNMLLQDFRFGAIADVLEARARDQLPC